MKRIMKTMMNNDNINDNINNDVTDNKVRDLYLSTGLSYAEIAKITNIKYNTISVWITGKRKVPTYKYNYMVYAINNYNRRNECNGDVIRNMTNQQLSSFLSDMVGSITVDDKGEVVIPDLYKNFDKFVAGTELVTSDTVKMFYKDYMEVPAANIEPFEEWLKTIVNNNYTTLQNIAKITNISKNNIIGWGYKGISTSPEIYDYIKDLVHKDIYKCRNNGDVIRRKDNENLSKFLKTFFYVYVKAEGKKDKVQPKFQNINDYIESTSMVTFGLNSKRDYKYASDKTNRDDKE